MNKVSSFRNVDRSPERDQLHVRFKEDDNRSLSDINVSRENSGRYTVEDKSTKIANEDLKSDREVGDNIQADLRSLHAKIDRGADNLSEADAASKFPSGEEKHGSNSGNESEGSSVGPESRHFHDYFDEQILNLDEDSRKYFHYFHLLESIEDGCLMKTKKGMAGDAPSLDSFPMFKKVRFWMIVSWGVNVSRDDWSLCCFTDQIISLSGKNSAIKTLPIREISEVYLDPKRAKSFRIYRGREVTQFSPQETTLTAPQFADAIYALLQLHAQSTDEDMQYYYTAYRAFVDGSPSLSPKKSASERVVPHKRSTLFVKMKQIFTSTSNLSSPADGQSSVRRWSFSRSKSVSDASNNSATDNNTKDDDDHENTQNDNNATHDQDNGQQHGNDGNDRLQGEENGDQSTDKASSPRRSSKSEDFLSQSVIDFHTNPNGSSMLRTNSASRDDNDADLGDRRNVRSGSESDGSSRNNNNNARPGVKKQLSTVMKSSMESMGSFLGLTSPTSPIPSNHNNTRVDDSSNHSSRPVDEAEAIIICKTEQNKTKVTPKTPAEELGRITVLDRMYQQSLEQKAQNRLLYSRYQLQHEEEQEHEQYRRYQQHMEELQRLQENRHKVNTIHDNSNSNNATNSNAKSFSKELLSLPVQQQKKVNQRTIPSPQPQAQPKSLEISHKASSFDNLGKKRSQISSPSNVNVSKSPQIPLSNSNAPSRITSPSQITRTVNNKQGYKSPSPLPTREQQLTDFLLGKTNSPTSPASPPPIEHHQTVNEKAKKGYFQRTFSGFTGSFRTNNGQNSSALRMESQGGGFKSSFQDIFSSSGQSSSSGNNSVADDEQDNEEEDLLPIVTTGVSPIGKQASPYLLQSTNTGSNKKNVYAKRNSFIHKGSRVPTNAEKRASVVTNVDEVLDGSVDDDFKQEMNDDQHDSDYLQHQSSQNSDESRPEELPIQPTAEDDNSHNSSSTALEQQQQPPAQPPSDRRASTNSNYGLRFQQLFQGVPPINIKPSGEQQSRRSSQVVSPTNLKTFKNELLSSRSNDKQDDRRLSVAEATRRESMRRTSLILQQHQLDSHPFQIPSRRSSVVQQSSNSESKFPEMERDEKEERVAEVMPVTKSIAVLYEYKEIDLTLMSKEEVKSKIISSSHLLPTRRGLSLSPLRRRPGELEAATRTMSVIAAELLESNFYLCFDSREEELFFVPLQAMIILQVDAARSGLFRMALTVHEKKKYACVHLRSPRNGKVSAFAVLIEAAGLNSESKKSSPRKSKEKLVECLFEAQLVEVLPSWLHTVMQQYRQI